MGGGQDGEDWVLECGEVCRSWSALKLALLQSGQSAVLFMAPRGDPLASMQGVSRTEAGLARH